VLDASGGNMSQAARILGLERSHFYRKLRSLRLERIDRSPAPR
jgi:transcriptional regulator of acetoin/glycerol metabolism